MDFVENFCKLISSSVLFELEAVKTGSIKSLSNVLSDLPRTLLTVLITIVILI